MRVLILGGAGMLGHKLFQLLPERLGEVACTVRHDQHSSLSRVPLFRDGDVTWGIDAMDFEGVARVVRARRPDVVVNAIGIIKQRPQAHDTIPSIELNSLLPHRLAALLAEWGGRLIHISTDCVFSGRRGGYREDDVPDPLDLYGRSKLLGEVVEAPNAVTLRTSMIGRELFGHRSLLDWFLSRSPGPVTGYRRVIYSGLTTNELAGVVGRLVTGHPELHGLFHVAGRAISKHDLLTLVAKAYALDVMLTPSDEPVSDRSLAGDRFAATAGYTAPDWPALVSALAADRTPYAEWHSLLSHD
jgi:dTDP-4-dehydrorhamnose reductase